MKHIKLFEDQKVKPRLSDFIYHKFLSDVIKTAKCRDRKSEFFLEKRIHNSWILDIEFKTGTYYYDKKILNFLSSILDRLKEFEQPNKKNVTFSIIGNVVCILIIISFSKITEIKSSQEYQNWYNELEREYIKYREHDKLKKDMKKYNL